MKIDSMRYDYKRILTKILNKGDIVAPRGLITRELQGVEIVLKDPTDAIPVGIGRDLNLSIAAAEAIQLIGGFSDPVMMVDISKAFSRFIDDGKFWGAYGVRIGTQLDDVVRKLLSDRDSRQAIITLWNPEKDNVDGMHDYPCTVALQFMIRKDKLVMHTHMRSNDAFLGLPYDCWQFTQLQLTIAHILGVEAGPYHHHAVSLHLYESDFEAVDKLYAPTLPPLSNVVGVNGARYTDSSRERVYLTRYRAFRIGTGQDVDSDTVFTESERWYQDQLAAYKRSDLT